MAWARDVLPGSAAPDAAKPPEPKRHQAGGLKKVVQRLMRAIRRYAHSKTGRKHRSHPLSAFCFRNADFWKEQLDKLLTEE